MDPGVWPAPEAARLAASGYWRPFAIRGNVSATRLGAYSLVCNPPATTTSVPHTFADDGGNLLDGVLTAEPGLYPVAQP